MENKKICLVTYGSVDNPKTWSGTTNTIYNYFLRQGYSISNIDIESITGRKTTPLYKKILGRFIFFYRTTRDPFLYKKCSKKINEAISKNDSNIFLFIADYCFINKDPSKKYIVYIDAVLPELIKYDSWRPFKKVLLHLHRKNDLNSLKSFDLILTQNDWTKKYCLNNYGLEYVENVSFGINTSFFDGDKNYSNHTMLIILRKGREKVKGLKLLLSAFKYLKKNIPDAKLYVVGTDYKHIDGVFYYPDCSREEKELLYKNASLYVMPAIREPNGITYLEALAHKTPIIALNRFSTPEFTQNGSFGFLVQKPKPKSLAKCIASAMSKPDE